MSFGHAVRTRTTIHTSQLMHFQKSWLTMPYILSWEYEQGSFMVVSALVQSLPPLDRLNQDGSIQPCL